MNAQYASPSNFRSRQQYRRPPVRARLGLALRRSMNFGPLGDIEPTMQAQGLSLAPISTGAASESVGGVTVLATAQAGDITNGALKGLVLPGGDGDAAGDAAVRELLDIARAKGVPVLAFGEGVVQATRAMGLDPAAYADAPAVLVDEGVVTALADMTQVNAAAARMG